MKHTYGRPGASQDGVPTKPSEWDLPSQSGSFSSMFQQLGGEFRFHGTSRVQRPSTKQHRSL